MRVPVSVTFDTLTHADIIEWLDAQPNRAEAIRIACRAYVNSGILDGDNVLDAVQRLENSLVEIQRRLDGLQEGVKTARITSRDVVPKSKTKETNTTKAENVADDILSKLDNIGL